MEEKNIQSKKKDYLLPISIVLAALIIGGAFVYSKGLNIQKQQAALEETKTNVQNGIKLAILDDQPVLGKADAPVTIFEYSDFQCPYCRRFQMLAHLDIVKDYVEPGLAKIVFIDVPFHGDLSFLASQATWCAKEQNKYWEMHDAIFSKADDANTFKTESLIKIAGDLKLDTDAFSNCLNSQKYAQRISQSLDSVTKMGIYGTPSIIVTKTNKLPLTIDALAIQNAFNGNQPQVDLGGATLLIGAQPYSTVKSVIDSYVK